jgi:hypothetical protein
MAPAVTKTASIPRHGCWTCFLRRKKCPGDRPDCSICRRFGITCYGYGPKPVWMIGGTEEIERRDEIRRSVKLTTDKLRPSRALNSILQRQQQHTAKAHPKGHIGQNPSSPVGHQNRAVGQLGRSTVSSQSMYGLPQATRTASVCTAKHVVRSIHSTCSLRMLSKAAGDTSSTSTSAVQGSVDSLLWSGNPQRNYGLLMHYRDVVFPLQFPLYNPSITDGGTVWFSIFLMQTKPLYNTVLSIAAYHQKSLLSSNKPTTAAEIIEGDEENLYNMALKGLREDISNLSAKSYTVGLRDSLKVLACVVQLIVFEASRLLTK